MKKQQPNQRQHTLLPPWLRRLGIAALTPRATAPLQSAADLKKTFNAVDKVGEFTVFDVGGNKYRLIAYIRFERQIVYIKAVLHIVSTTKESGNHECTD